MKSGLKRELLTATGAAAMLLLSQAAHATTIVATIIGAYDASSCSAGNGYCGTENGTTITNYATNGGTVADTPSLFILNPNSTSMTGASLVLTGYQDFAGGNSAASLSNTAPNAAVTDLALPAIAPHTVYQLIWNGGSGGGVTDTVVNGTNLFAYDYDDTEGNAAGTGTTDSLGHTCGSGTGALTTICAYVGNFDAKFSATLNGGPIAANFSPDNTQDGGNVAGSFVGWEGLDADGLSETHADAHTATFPGTLAVITTGTKGAQPTPEPGTLALVGAALGALGVARRRRKRS